MAMVTVSWAPRCQVQNSWVDATTEGARIGAEGQAHRRAAVVGCGIFQLIGEGAIVLPEG